jgi:hypothetical protein
VDYQNPQSSIAWCKTLKTSHILTNSKVEIKKSKQTKPSGDLHSLINFIVPLTRTTYSSNYNLLLLGKLHISLVDEILMSHPFTTFAPMPFG